MIPDGSLANEKIRDEKTLYEDILILSESKNPDWSENETPTALTSQAVINFVSKWGRHHKWILFGDRNSTNFLNSGVVFSAILDVELTYLQIKPVKSHRSDKYSSIQLAATCRSGMRSWC